MRKREQFRVKFVKWAILFMFYRFDYNSKVLVFWPGLMFWLFLPFVGQIIILNALVHVLNQSYWNLFWYDNDSIQHVLTGVLWFHQVYCAHKVTDYYDFLPYGMPRVKEDNGFCDKNLETSRAWCTTCYSPFVKQGKLFTEEDAHKNKTIAYSRIHVKRVI